MYWNLSRRFLYDKDTCGLTNKCVRYFLTVNTSLLKKKKWSYSIHSVLPFVIWNIWKELNKKLMLNMQYRTCSSIFQYSLGLNLVMSSSGFWFLGFSMYVLAFCYITLFYLFVYLFILRDCIHGLSYNKSYC